MTGRPGTLETDVLVIGSGAAGGRAAIEVARNGLRVLMVTKGAFNRSGASVTAGMSINLPSREAKDLFGLPGDTADTAENFAQDICVEGKHLNNQENVLTVCTNAGKRIKELVDWGMRVDGLSQDPGHRYPRAILSSGPSMVRALKRGMQGCAIDFAEYTVFTHLISKQGKVIGAAGIDSRTGEALVVRAKATILATGGAMRLYPITTAPEELTGDGLRMAYEAGAELVDMEFPMFLPCCLYWPQSMSGNPGPYVFTYQLGGWWLNKYGVRFIEKWDPLRREAGTTRDIASVAMATEILAGRGGPHGGVFASFKHLPDELIGYAVEENVQMKGILHGNFPFERFNMDPRMVAYEVGPACHFWNGGIRVNASGETTVPGLWAVGEAQGGTRGANRLSGSAVTECVVFGALAGRGAAQYARGVTAMAPERDYLDSCFESVFAPLTRKDGIDVYEVRKVIQDMAFKYLGPIREESSITECLKEVETLRKDMLPNQATKSKAKICNREWVMALENQSLAGVLEIVARASLARKESRGAMYRKDYPDTDNAAWLKNIFVKKAEDHVTLEPRPVASRLFSPPEKVKVPYMVPQWKFEKR